MPARPPQPRARRSQAERTAETRGRLLDAAERALIEVGYYGTSTPEVCKRAGVSHGSLLHHFGTREALLAATLERLYERRTAQVLAALEAAGRSRDRVRTLVERMWAIFEAPDFKVVVELWLAVANEPGLRRRVLPVMRAFDAAIQPTAARVLPELARRPRRFRTAVGMLFDLLQGMGLSRVAFGRDAADPAHDAAERALLVRLLASVQDEP
ncbi:MAG: TetR family transcriptional regulator [Proteobacteria bacterium]|nr:MAG: TetR family transcriptional regulator [Pseudomonadota bacterium]